MNTRSFLLEAAAAGLLSLATLAGCGAAEDEGVDSGSSCEGGKCDEADGTDGAQDEDRSVCVALRGNGDRIFSTLTSMGRVVEHYGPLHASAGGSSGSIATFLAESIQMNSALYDCGETACSDEEAGVRAALMYKSTQGYFGVLTQSEEAVAMMNLAPLAAQVQDAGLEELAAEDIAMARAALEDLLRSDDLRGIVNPELLATLQTSPNPEFHVRDMIAGLQNFGSFSTEEPSILIRPGLVDFTAAADLIGRIGSFYAGYEPADTAGQKLFLDACALPGRGMNWSDVAALPAGDATCGELFGSLVVDYREQVKADEANFPNRADDMVGTDDFHSLIATSVLTDAAADTWRQARADYNAGQEWSLQDVAFEDVDFGWFGSAQDLEAIADNPQGYEDLKTAKTVALGQVTWREALTYSPAEPGIARALELEGTDMVSAGGWPDLQPVLALKNIGCDEVVYVTRAGEASSFSTGMATLLHASDEEMRQLYDLESAGSGYALSLAEADATWCTNWNEIGGFELQRLTDDAYFADMETDDDFFLTGDSAYDGTVPRSEGRVGCSIQASIPAEDVE